MRTFIFEAVQQAGVPQNWGKFLVGVPDMEWARHPGAGPETHLSLLATQGWGPEHVWVCDLATGEGAYFRLGGDARADLDKHRIWVCPLFEEFLKWLYAQNIETLHLLPPVVELPDAAFSINGHRRLGPHDVSFTLRAGDVITVEWGDEPRLVICEAITAGGAVIRDLTAEEAAMLDQAVTEIWQLTSGGETAEVMIGQDDPGSVLSAGEVRELEARYPASPEQPAETVRLLPVDAQDTMVFPAIDAAETAAIEAAKED